MTWVIKVETSPYNSREQRVVRLHELFQSFQISLSDDYDNIECPVVLACRQFNRQFIPDNSAYLLESLP
jgi:hypothetical protein